MVAIMTGVLGIAYITGLAAYLVAWFRQSSWALDDVFVPRGLAPRNYLVLGREYSGQIQGRQVDIRYLPPRALQPALLNMIVGAELHSRLAVGEQRPLLDCRECPRLDVSGPGLSHLQVFAEDTAWASRLLAEPAIRGMLGSLMSDQVEVGLRELYIQPDRVWMHARPSSRAAREQFGLWLDGLLALARAAEAVK